MGLQLAKSEAERKKAQEQLDFLAKASTARAQEGTAGGAAAGSDPATSASCFQAGAPDACAKLAISLEDQCAQGSASACGGLAWILQNGRGVTQDVRRAEELYGRACDGGERRSCLERAAILASGADPAKGLAELESLCEAKLTAACTRLAVAHAGRQTPKDLARARELLEKACTAQDAGACRLLRSLPK
jgi:TPR repeat protein